MHRVFVPTDARQSRAVMFPGRRAPLRTAFELLDFMEQRALARQRRARRIRVAKVVIAMALWLLAVYALTILFMRKAEAAPALSFDDTLTIIAPSRGDVFTGRYEMLNPAGHSIEFDVVNDAPFSTRDRITHADFDAEWTPWTVVLCDDGSCGTEIDLCALSVEAPFHATLECLKVDC